MNFHSSAISSKLPSRRSKNEFYRYYAGYPLEFADWALGELNLAEGSLLIDPWNGSGTTVAACARRRISCHGFDMNPVMVHLARARVAAMSNFEEAEILLQTTEKILPACQQTSFAEVGSAFREIPVGNEFSHSLAIAALYPFARKSLDSSRTRNPSWFKKGASLAEEPISKEKFFDTWRYLLGQVSEWRSTQEDTAKATIQVSRGDSRKSLGRKEAFDGLLTSPPYLTRLDYVQATLPEILLLKSFDTFPDMQRLRRSMLGSPLTSARPNQSLDRLPDPVADLLRSIEAHPSKASATYYHRFFFAYFVDLQVSLKNIAKVLKSGAMGCIVVQSSHYKEIEVDLARMLISIAGQMGLRHVITYEFDSRRSMSLVNSRAHIDAQKPKNESAVFIRKD